jgi:hypothetical protein
MRNQNRIKLVVAIVLLLLAVVLLLCDYRQQRSVPTTAGEQLAEAPTGTVDSPGTGHDACSLWWMFSSCCSPPWCRQTLQA